MAAQPEIINLIKNLPEIGENECFETLWKKPGIHIERIISKGHCSEPGFWYDQNWDEWVLVLQGQAIVEFEQHTVTLSSGDSFLIPAHIRHRIQWTDPEQETIWLAVHSSI